MVALAVVVLSLSLCVGSGAGVVGASPADEPVFKQSPPETSTDSNESNSSRHEHPDEADEEGDLDGMQRYLASQMASSLGQSSVEISEGEYDQARQLVGDDYNEQLGRYVEIAGETDSGADEETAREFEEAAQNQREFANSAESYEETYEEYQEASEAGDEERARELARELERQSETTGESGTALEENYGDLEGATGEDLSQERQAVEEKRQEIQAQQAEIRELEFVGTEIQIESATEAISFTRPLELEGRLVTETGEPIANQEVAFAIGEQTVTTTTDDDGAFSLTYRPTTLPLETSSLEIQYEPAASTEYARSSTTVPVAVSQTEPTVAIESAPQSVAFGDEATIAGTVGLNGNGAAGVPVVIRIGDERIGEVRTNADGTFELTGTVPGAVPSGDREISAELALQEQALASVETTQPVVIEETDTRLSMTATESDEEDDVIAVSGRLATADGRTLSNQPVRILADGTAVGTVETNDAGEYRTTIDAPPTTDGTVEVTAVYDNAGTNFASSRATDTVSGISITYSLLDTLQRFGPAIILGGVGLILLAWDFRRGRRTVSDDARSYGLDRDSTTEASPDATPRVSASTLLGLARERLDEGETDRAIGLAYVAVRTHFGSTDAPGWTHWEFYNEAANQLEDAERDTLLSITEQFEHAVFAPVSISETAAAAVISAAEHLIGDGQDQSSQPSAQAAD
ncbi:hypothetical protein ACFQKF_13220 [Halalkalicoccus sp. GCM10025322]|uniref:hypothetical protein n=1 Tax=Halalkalicoccus TaxID=332246 RepID=UPI002F965F91